MISLTKFHKHTAEAFLALVLSSSSVLFVLSVSSYVTHTHTNTNTQPPSYPQTYYRLKRRTGRNLVHAAGDVADEWSSLAPMPDYRSGCRACELGSMMYVAAGGWVMWGISSVLRFDPASGSWSTVAPMSRSRWYFGLFVLGGCMYAADGYRTEQLVEKYGPDTDSWSNVSPMLGNGRRYVCAQSVTTRAQIVKENLFDMLIAKATAARRG